MRCRSLLVAVLAAVGAAGLTGCAIAPQSARPSSAAGVASSAQGPARMAGAVPAASGATAGGRSSSGAAGVAEAAGAGGDVVVGSPAPGVSYSVTASYVVPHGQFLSAFETVIASAAGLGGSVMSSRTSPDRSGRIVSGEVTVSVPTLRLASLLNGMPGDWIASSIDFASVDHRSDLVDVPARLSSAQAHLSALQSLLAKATSLSDITMLEQQIEEVEAAIDTDRGQLASLQQSVAYATATIGLREQGTPPAVTSSPGGPSVSGGVSAGWTNAVLVTSILLEVLVTALPPGLLALAGWLAWRRMRARRPAARAPSAT